MDTETIFKFIGQMIAYAGGAATIAYLLFQYLGKAWIENKFSERLEQMRHDQALELQRLKVEIDSLLSGAIKLQEREFEVLPAAWEKLDVAHGQISWLVSPMQTYANVDRMNSIQLDEFLEGTEFTASQKDEIKNSRNKGDSYRDILFWYRLRKVQNSFGDLQKYVVRNGIFFEPELKEKLSKVADSLWSALVDKEVGHEAKDWKMQNEGWKKLKEETEPLYKEIEEYIHQRLQSHGRKQQISNN
jgi:hypothetical protein